MKGLNLFRKDTRSRITALALAAVMALSGIQSIPAQAEGTGTATSGVVEKVADLETLHRPIDIYGQNTLNAGKITVGKSVSTQGFKDSLLDDVSTGGLAPADNNFLVTLSQSAQAVGLASKMPVPVDAVFVLDTSGSMDDTVGTGQNSSRRYVNMINAANEAISALLAANSENRVAVVAFSSDGYGDGTSDDKAASVLSDLAHYDDTETSKAASAHLQRVDGNGDADASGSYVAGRNQEEFTYWVQENSGGPGGPGGNNWVQKTKTTNAFRRAENGGTNIQAGIALGADILMQADPITTVEGEQVTRMPFIIVLSDGAPTYSSNAEKWYDAASIASAGQQGPGGDPYAGNGFLAAMTAAYYKGKITEHYYGANANEENHCTIYTIGVDVKQSSSVSEEDVALAEMTLNPTGASTSNTYYNTFNSYWNNYNKTNATNFNIKVNSGNQSGNFTITVASITASQNYVHGNRVDTNNTEATSDDTIVNMYAGGLGYNDAYLPTSGGSTELSNTFKELVRLIQIKAISIPTDTTVSADFGGYVHFYDPIGEYMEVKDVHGIVADGYFFRGASFAKNMVNYGTTNADASFDAAITRALNGRLALSESNALGTADIMALVEHAKAADGQLYYNSNSDYENSFCWWGTPYLDDNGDEHMQYLGFAVGDSIEDIEAAKESGTIPVNAEYVCRSYYYYGTAGGAIEPVADFLLIAVRVQRSLEAPYQETVYVSIPGSLLSVDRVLITEDHTQSSVTYEAFVQAENPVRVIYEVGLQSDINAQNVAQKLAGTDYVAEKTLDKRNGEKDNYEAGADTYYFYTNDWDRSKGEDSHERALAHAGFDVATDNDFYAFVEDTLLYKDTSGTPATNLTTGETYYYKRTYFDWTNATAKNTEGTLFACTPKEEYIPVVAPSADVIAQFADQNASGQWYVKAGTYTGYSLSAANDDTVKSENVTGTSTIVAHPMRTNAEHDSHYTVYLGNNGRFALKADKTKTVQINADATAQITDNDGNLITVGDVLTYTIKVVNNEDTAANAVVTDSVPYGTVLGTKMGFDPNGTEGVDATYSINGDEITWNITNIPAGKTVCVSFEVIVTEKALDQNVITVNNAATIQIGNNPAYTTNKVENPPYGKLVEGVGSANPEEGVKVGDELTYRINYYNALDTTATIGVEDIIPTGTTYVDGSATHNGTYANGVVTWTLDNVGAGVSGYVSFRVVVNESAKTPVVNGATITIGNNSYTTNTTGTSVLTGDLVLSKTVDGAGSDNGKEFEFVLTSIGAENATSAGISGTFKATRVNIAQQDEEVIFTNGVAKVKMKHGDTLTIQGLPAGLSLNITETAAGGYTPTISNENVIITSGTTVAKSDVINTYSATPFKFQLHGTKILNTDEYFDDANFIFEVYRYKDVSQPWTGEVEFATSADATVSSTKKSAGFSFAPRMFTIADVGTHYYQIIEKIPVDSAKINGVTYDSTIYYLKLEVTNNGNGAINVVSSIYDANKNLIACNGDEDSTNDITNTTITFTNKYDTATILLHGTKILKNQNLTAGQFAFEVLDDNNNVVSRGQNDADGKIVFTPITYTQKGTYNYTVKENNGGLSNYQYDTKEYSVIVTVSEENDKLVANITGVENSSVVNNEYNLVFTNYYIPTSTSFDLNGKKILDNRSGDAAFNLKAGQFTFEVIDAAGKVVSTGTNDANGNIDFGLINISAVSTDLAAYENGVTYTYKVKEVVPTGGAKDPYMNYDTNEITISVLVTVDKTTGKLVATPSGNNPEIKFENVQYPSSVQITPVGNKVTLDSAGNPADLPNSTFSFHVVDVNTGKEATVGVGAANGAITFRPITYTTPNTTYVYWIKESNASNTNTAIEYAQNRYKMVVNVNDDMTTSVAYFGYDSTLGNVEDPNAYTTVITDSGKLIFTNKYHATGQLNITAAKQLSGKAMQNAGEFAFKLQPTDLSGILITGNEVDGISYADGTVKFATLYYTSGDLNGANEQTLYYKMSEFVPATNKTPGITYDQSEYILTVKLSGDTDAITTTLVSIKQIKDASGNAVTNPTEVTLNNNGATGVTFNNKYQAVNGTSATIKASKELVGRRLNAGEFIFNLYYVNGTDETLVATTTNGANGNVSFTRNYLPNAIDFAGADTKTYTYVIREESGDLGGVDYNPGNDEYWVTITITNNTSNAALEIANDGIKYYDRFEDIASDTPISLDAVEFTNKYTPQGTFFPLEGLKKVLNNRPMFDNEFAFEVRTNDNDNKLVSSGLAKADGSIVFSSIALDKANAEGEYYEYVIKETSGNMAGITYSTAQYYLRIKVTDNGMGDLVVSEAKYYSDAQYTNEITNLTDLVFTNTYTVHRITVPVEATKVLTGRDLRDNEFDFVLLDKPKSDSTATVIARADNVASTDSTQPDNVVFTLNYEYSEENHGAAQTYTYYMSEVAPLDGHAGGVIIDSKEYKVVVTISHDTENAKLISTVEYYDSEGAKLNTVPAFVNKYTTTAAEVSVNAQKILVGKELANDEFTFVVYESNENGAIGTEMTKVKNDADGVVKLFDKKSFNAAGTYYYKVVESNTATVLNNAAGEKIGEYTNDTTAYIIKVVVTDDLQGKLHATTTYYDASNNEVSGIDFTNYYTPSSIKKDLTAAINATKSVTSPNGYALEAGEFQFVVKDVTGTPVATGANEADGKIKFTDFTFTRPGEYRYWITEVVDASKEAYMTYDARSWEVHVTVSYAYDDILVENSSQVLYPAGTLYIADGAVKTYASFRVLEPQAPTFVNIYTPAPVSLTITADKKLTVPEGSERKLQAKEFTFRVIEGDVDDPNAIIRAESHNDADGNITFHFTENVVGKHTYTVVEYVPAVNANGIYYDKETKATIEVTVVDDGSGQLKIDNAESITKENVAVFTNKYEPTAATANISAKKVLNGAELTAGAFKFELVDRTLYKVVETVTNDADGMITFTQTFDKIGQYPFLIREVKGTDANVTYDTTEYPFMVEVKDNLVGQLVATVDFQREAVFENTFTPPVEPTPEPGEDDGRIYKSFAFVKVWNDNNDKLGKRPDIITVELYQDGVYVTDIILSKENGWTDTAILMYSKDDHVYEWTMKEKNVPEGYVASYNQSEHIVTNTLKGHSTITNGSGTGDDSNLGFFLGAVAVSLIAIIGLVVLMKFRKKDDK